MKCKKSSNKGFTLTEIVAVVIILGIIMLIAVPSISEYVLKSKDDTYTSHIKSMESSAENMVVECLSSNKEDCSLPSGGESSLVYLRDLIEMGYSEKLSDPESDGYCDINKSYVIIQSDSSSNSYYEYQACLFCSNYKSDKSGCVEYVNEGSNPICGDIVGEGVLWTNENRTITVGCKPGDNDAVSACAKDEFSKTFTSTTSESYITIRGNNNKTTSCPVTVRVDKDAPTCTLKISDDSTLGEDGWYSSDVKVLFDEIDDGDGSGVRTYGLSTSLDNRSYNKKMSYSVGNGVTTVFGYVQDYAGNEGICSLEVKSDQIKPEQTVQLGYQIYPSKSSITTSGLTISGNTYTTTSSDSYIDISSLTNYKTAKKVVLHFDEGLSKGVIGEVYYRKSGFDYVESLKVERIMTKGTTQMVFTLLDGDNNYEGIKVKITDPDGSGFSYKLNRIELVIEDDSEVFTNKNVTLYVNGTDTITGVSYVSFDDGDTWTTSTQKIYSTNELVKVRTKDKAGNISLATVVNIDNIDKTNPICELQLSGVMPEGASWYTSDVEVSFKTHTDELSGVKNYGIGGVTSSKSVIHKEDSDTDITYTGYIVDKAGNEDSCSISFKRNADYTVTYNNNSGSGCTTLAVTYGEAYGTLCTPVRTGYTFAGWYKDSGFTEKVEATSKVTTFTDHTLYAKWTANKYTIVFNGNGSTSGSVSSITCTYDDVCVLPTNSFIRTNYEFLGWSKNMNATSATYQDGATTSNVTASGTVNFYAIWKLSNVCKKVYFFDYTTSCCASYRGYGCYDGCFMDGRPAIYTGMYEDSLNDGGKCGYCLSSSNADYNIIKNWSWKVDTSATQKKKFYACYYFTGDGTPTTQSCTCP